jgi:uncharacterized protein YjiS (DUF1127 family)
MSHAFSVSFRTKEALRFPARPVRALKLFVERLRFAGRFTERMRRKDSLLRMNGYLLRDIAVSPAEIALARHPAERADAPISRAVGHE